jgi:hypothetical protein
MNRDQMIQSFVEIAALDRADFLKVKETLTRIGLPGKDRTLHQICYVLHKRGRYFICSHLELYRLDGQDIAFTEQDRAYRDAIVDLLVQWEGLGVKVISQRSVSQEPEARIKVIHFSEKSKWKLVPTYKIGMKKAG